MENTEREKKFNYKKRNCKTDVRYVYPPNKTGLYLKSYTIINTILLNITRITNAINKGKGKK